MEKDKWLLMSNICFKISLILFVIVMALSLFFILFYVHEFGHISFGFLNNLLVDRTISEFNITHWVNHPLIPFIKLPQRTEIIRGNGSLNFIFGGIFLTILFSIFISYMGYKISKDKLWFSLPIPIILHEIFGNYYCGTDNITNNPLEICNALNLGVITKISIWLFLAIILIIFYRSRLFKKINIFLEKISKPRRYRTITKLKPISFDDPQKDKKISYIKGVNRLSDQITSIKRDTENRILIFISIIFSGILGAFLTSGMYLESGLVAGILILLLFLTIIKEHKDKKNLYTQLDKIVKEAKDKTNLDLRQ